MFNIGFSEMLLIAAMALIFIGPKDLPQIARTLGRFLNELRRASDGLKSEFTNSISLEPTKKKPEPETPENPEKVAEHVEHEQPEDERKPQS
jgi:sec-independent protein translocase protein TatB